LRYDDAATCYARAAQVVGFSSFYFGQAIALALAGRLDEARLVLGRAQALEPNFRLRLYSEFGMEPSIVEKYLVGGRLLGLPE
jgi:hypothetical protein